MKNLWKNTPAKMNRKYKAWFSRTEKEYGVDGAE